MYLTRRDFLKLSSAAIVLSPTLPKYLFAYEIKIPVLLYHDISASFKDYYTVSPSNFASQMEWLYSIGYTALSFKEIRRFIENGGEKAVIITFDDGYASFVNYAFPLLQDYGFKATINIIGKYVGTFFPFGGNRPTLSWDEYRYLTKSGLVDLGSHSYDLHYYKHRGVLGISMEALENDLLLFQKTIKKEIGETSEILAWPYSKYDKNSINVARKAGFKYIITSSKGYFRKNSDLCEIPRLNINHKLDLVSFREYIGDKI